MSKTALVAVGGNSLIRAGEKGTIAEQLANTRRTAQAMVEPACAWLPAGHHPRQRSAGRGATAALRARLRSWYTAKRSMSAAPPARARSDTCSRSRCATNWQRAEIDVPVVSLVTQTLVSPEDPAMQHPTKPIGPFYSRADAEEKKRPWAGTSWKTRPAAIAASCLLPSRSKSWSWMSSAISSTQGVLVVSTGGGGIPVVRVDGQLHGIEAVIDKDRASALLAAKLEVDLFAISTDTDYVYLNYRKPDQTPLHSRDGFAAESSTTMPGTSRPATWDRRLNRCLQFPAPRRQGSGDHFF